jgi:carboxyl-terminal processing protease
MKHRFMSIALVAIFLMAISAAGILKATAWSFDAHQPSSLSQASDKKTNDKDKDNDKEKNLPNYKKYLDSSSELGFSPSMKIFSATHGLINSMFYGSADQAKLLDSTRAEVTRLLNDAKVQASFENMSGQTADEFIESAMNQYGTKVSRDLILYAGLCGLVRGTGDPYTLYMTPKEYNLLKEQMQSASFGGIGSYIERGPENNRRRTIIEAVEGSPAFRAGLKAGDVISEIDGKSTKGLSIDAAVATLRGLKGSNVTLTINRKGTNGSLKFTLARETIQIKSVSSKLLNNDIGYVRLRLFGENTAHELQDSLKQFQAQNVKGIIMDLRNNGGGYINAAVDISSLFLKNGEPIVKVMDKTGNSKVHNSRGDLKLSLPLVVLVNKYSASASEITAGALKDYKRGTLLGTKTFGKGSVQQLIPYPDGSALKVTVSHYYTPLGNDIDKKGLEPDMKVDMEPRDVGKDKDPQLEKALILLKGGQQSKR